MKLNDIEKYIKSKLSNHREERSDGDLLWANIAQELGAPAKPSPFAFLKKFKFYLLLSFPILLAGIAYLYHLKTLPIDAEISTLSIEKNNTQTDNQSIALEHQKPSKTTTENGEIKASSSEKINSQKPDNQIVESISTHQDNNKTSSKEKQFFSEENTFSSEKNETNQLTITTPTKQKETENITRSINVTKEELVLTENSTPEASTLINSPISTGKSSDITSSFNALSTTDIEPLPISLRGLPFRQAIPKNIEPVKPKAHWQILASSGVQYAALNLSATDNSELSKSIIETQTPELGWHSGIEVQHLRPSGWTFSSGLRYQKDWVKFEFQSQQMDSILKENVIVKISINSETRDTIDRVYGDAAVATTTTYRVVHFNEFKRISIPLSIGYQKRKNKWTYGIDVGGNINFLLQQNGRLFSDNQTVIDYNKQSPIYRKLNFSAHLRPHLAYQINAQWSIFTRPSVHFSLNNIVEATSFSSVPKIGMFTLGTIFSL